MNRIPFDERVFQLTDEWSLTSIEQWRLFGVGTTDKAALTKLIKRTPRSNLGRLGILVEIQACIHELLPRSRWKRFIRSKNDYFYGKSPMEVMMSDPEQGCERVYSYLDIAVRSGYR